MASDLVNSRGQGAQAGASAATVSLCRLYGSDLFPDLGHPAVRGPCQPLAVFLGSLMMEASDHRGAVAPTVTTGAGPALWQQGPASGGECVTSLGLWLRPLALHGVLVLHGGSPTWQTFGSRTVRLGCSQAT